MTSSRVLSSRRECSRLLPSRRNHRAFLQTFQVFQGSEESVGTHRIRSEALWEVFRRLSSSDQGSEEPNTEPRTSIEPPWKPSTSHCVIVRVRGPGRSRASLRQASEEPEFDLREASKLRRAHQLAAVRVSVPLEPLDERQSRIRHPKKPSTVHRPMSEPRSEPLGKCPRCFRNPKTPSAILRLTSLPRVEPVGEHPARVKAPKSPSPNHHSRRSPAKLSNKHQRHFRAPKNSSVTPQLEVELRVEPSDERQACRRPPKKPLTGHRLAFQPRGTIRQASPPLPSSEEPFRSASTHFPAPSGTFHRASGQRQASKETVNRSSTRIRAPGGERHRASQSPQGSEEPFSDSSTRLRTPGNSSRSSEPSQDPEGSVNDPSKQPELPRNTSTNARFVSGVRRIHQQSVVSLPRTWRAIEQASRPLPSSEELV